MVTEGVTPKRLSVDERRAQLLDAGRRMFNENRYEDVAVERIAAELGISTGLLYHYFPKKLGFFVTCASCELDDFLERLDSTRELASAPQRLDAGLDLYLEFVSSESGGAHNVLRLAGQHPEVAEVLTRLRTAVAAHVLEALGVEETPTLRTALIGFHGYAEAATLDWISRGDVDGAVLKTLLANCLAHTIASAASLDGVAVPRRTLRAITTN